MKYTQLGKSDLSVSRICFGCWQLSPKFWGDVPIGPWEDALDAALDAGVNVIDTANAYGDGYAEECLGAWFQKSSKRDDFIVATKFYWNFKAEPRHPDTRYDEILAECEASLQRLQTDRIDLYQVHAYDPLTRPDEVGEALHRLQGEGKVRWFGVSNLNAEQMRMYARHFDIVSYQPIYNLIERDAEKVELPYCQAERIGVIPYSSLMRGLLTGKYERDQTFDDARANLSVFQQPLFGRILDAMDELRPIAEDFGLSVAQLSIRWILTHPAITAPIVGIKTRDHIETIAQAADDVLPVDAWHRVAVIVARAKAG